VAQGNTFAGKVRERGCAGVTIRPYDQPRIYRIFQRGEADRTTRVFIPKAETAKRKPHLLDSVGDTLQRVQLLLSHRLEKGLRVNTEGRGSIESGINA